MNSNGASAPARDIKYTASTSNVNGSHASRNASSAADADATSSHCPTERCGVYPECGDIDERWSANGNARSSAAWVDVIPRETGGGCASTSAFARWRRAGSSPSRGSLGWSHTVQLLACSKRPKDRSVTVNGSMPLSASLATAVAASKLRRGASSPSSSRRNG